MLRKMMYRLALDLGSTSLGWAMFRLNAEGKPYALIKAGVRIFSDGRNPKDGSSLAVTRRLARGMRRRRDRLLKRKQRMLNTLIDYGFFPADQQQRAALVDLNPYELRAKALDQELTPAEFARAVFHLNQRRGFKSNRKTDKKDSESGALKTAITRLRNDLQVTNCRTVGEWLWQRHQQGQSVRARLHEQKISNANGKVKNEKNYDLYIDRAMVEQEFDAIWQAQAKYQPQQYSQQAYLALKDTLLHQRKLRAVKPGRCSFFPDEERAPVALPSAQRSRIYQELNHLRILDNNLAERTLTLAQRDILADYLDKNSKCTFKKICALLDLGTVQFNLEDAKRTELKGNLTNAILSGKDLFGIAWYQFSETMQDQIVSQLLNQEDQQQLINWLQQQTGINEAQAEAIADKTLPEGYGSLSKKALDKILPELRRQVISYDKAVIAAGFASHSQLQAGVTGEVFQSLPYYGEVLQRHVGFGTGNPEDHQEKRYGKIANPTVHIGLNQLRKVINDLIADYGHPAQVVLELARDLKQSKASREEEQKQQAKNQKRNERLRQEIAGILQIEPDNVKRDDLQKMILWEELSFDPLDRRCPYSGVQLSVQMVLSEQVEIEHILPYSRTLDDSLNNKTVAIRQANRYKANLTPYEAFAERQVEACNYQEILARAQKMPKAKRYRFAEDGYQRWLKEDKDFLARALNDTRYLSKISAEYLRLICPKTWVIPGQLTAMLRAKLGLNSILGVHGEKNRHDHRHHAVDACVIGVTDESMLKKFAHANANLREQQSSRLIADLDEPFYNYRDHVERAIERIWVSHKPDHSHEGEIFDATIYSASGKSKAAAKDRLVIPFVAGHRQVSALKRHGYENGQPKPYKGLLSNSNYCIEIFRTENNKWDAAVLRTFDAYQIVRQARTHQEGMQCLRNSMTSSGGQPLIARLMINDYIRLEIDGNVETLQVLKINSTGSVTFIKPNESNISARYSSKLAAQKAQKEGKEFDADALNDDFFQRAFSVQSLKQGKARRVTVSVTGKLHDPGFRE